jgi:hypothetical protein
MRRPSKNDKLEGNEIDTFFEGNSKVKPKTSLERARIGEMEHPSSCSSFRMSESFSVNQRLIVVGTGMYGRQIGPRVSSLEFIFHNVLISLKIAKATVIPGKRCLRPI